VAVKWRMAKALEVLRQQINETWPGRSLAADGGIGNAEHAARKSDHNPDANGVVTARDFTHDLRVGFDSNAFAHALTISGDSRIDYVISFGRSLTAIFGDNGKGRNAWIWQVYKGKNRHDHHVHVSVIDDPQFYDDTGSWNYGSMKVDRSLSRKGPDRFELPTIVKGVKGRIVKEAQQELIACGYKIVADGWFGDKTEDAVKRFQRLHGLVADGAIGPSTWTALLTGN
jgi:hypothetical protein